MRAAQGRKDADGCGARNECAGAVEGARCGSRDRAKLEGLRLVSAAVKDRDIEARGRGQGQASNEDLLGLLAKMIRQREESATLYEGAGRPELADKERAEIAVIRAFLPQPMTDDGDGGRLPRGRGGDGRFEPRDMGRVMAALKARYAGRVDLGRANGVVKGLLA